MLRHVDLQEQVVEFLERRRDRDEQRTNPAHERRESPAGEAIRHLAMQADEAARVNRRCHEQHRDRRDGRRPRIEGVLYYRVHCDAGTAGCAESRAGGWPCGCIVLRNATIALTSAGLRFLPYAGMLPPPWMICRTIWSRVRRVAVASRAGPRRPPSPPSEWQLRHCLL